MKPIERAAVIAVGSELLTPARYDTNSLFITEQLNLLAIEVVAKAVVGDDRNELAHVFRAFLERVDLVICCGGLGPTDDDVTREAVAGVIVTGTNSFTSLPVFASYSRTLPSKPPTATC